MASSSHSYTRRYRYYPVDSSRQTINITSTGRKVPVNIEEPNYMLGFVFTVNKAQSQTIPRIITDLTPSVKNFYALYVNLTRIKEGAHFRIIAKPDELDFIDNLRPDLASAIGFSKRIRQRRQFQL